MRLNLNRYGAMCNGRGLLILMGLLFLGLSPVLLSEKGYSLVVSLVVVSLIILFYPLRFSKKAYVDKGMVSYATMQLFHRRFSTRGTPVKVHYTVTAIEEVVLIQNGVERLFKIGRIRFRGDSDLDADYDKDELREKDGHILYGVTKFQEVRKDLRQYFIRVSEA